MLSVEEALSLVLAEARALPAEQVATSESLGLVLAEDVASDVDSPPHDKSVVDGYAIRSQDFAAGVLELDVIEEVTAGRVPQKLVAAGQATRVMTGAPIPGGADAMVMVEKTAAVDSGPAERIYRERVRILDPTVRPGQNIMPRAASLQRGAVVLRSGCEIRPIEIGVLAEVGRSQVTAIRRPAVAVLPTGDELVSIRDTPGPGQIRNSNGPMLLAAAARAGADIIDLGIGRDEVAQLERLVAEGLNADILIVSGGVSAGVLDLVPGVLERLGVERVLYKVDLKPGKPLWFGVLRSTPVAKLVFGLPGNPVSSLVCFELFVRPAIARLAGRGDGLRKTVSGRLAGDYAHRGQRPTYQAAQFCETPAGGSIRTLPSKGSGDLAALVEANALAKFPAGDRIHAAGTIVEAILL